MTGQAGTLSQASDLRAFFFPIQRIYL
uniref:Uncharacterized protein n=1 Tax=Anguilla anguilla TaxID=7936 RepID=A0A0E9URV9_ANGAN